MPPKKIKLVKKDKTSTKEVKEVDETKEVEEVKEVKDDDVETENENENEEEDDFFEIEIDDITYCTNNEESGIIYAVDKDGDIGERVGYLKNGEPFFDNE